MAGEEAAAAAGPSSEQLLADGKEPASGGYDGKCVFCRIARREEPGTALLPCQVGRGGPAGGRVAAAAALVVLGSALPRAAAGSPRWGGLAGRSRRSAGPACGVRRQCGNGAAVSVLSELGWQLSHRGSTEGFAYENCRSNREILRVWRPSGPRSLSEEGGVFISS